MAEKVTATVECAYCQGSGKDRFRLLSALSACGACGGKGQVEIGTPYVDCAFCGATGIHPRSRLTCTACGGKGVIHVAEPTTTCPICRGVGRGNMAFYCARCHGAGVIPAAAEAVAALRQSSGQA